MQSYYSRESDLGLGDKKCANRELLKKKTVTIISFGNSSRRRIALTAYHAYETSVLPAYNHAQKVDNTYYLEAQQNKAFYLKQ